MNQFISTLPNNITTYYVNVNKAWDISNTKVSLQTPLPRVTADADKPEIIEMSNSWCNSGIEY